MEQRVKVIPSQLLSRQYQEALIYLGHKALEEKDLSRLFNKAVFLLATILKNEYIRLWQFFSDGQTIKKVAGVVGEKFSNAPTIINPGLKNILETKKVFTLEKQNPPSAVAKLLPQTYFNYNSGIIVAITGEDSVLGLIEVYSERVRFFSSTELDLLKSVANILATAVNRKRSESLLEIQNQILESLTSTHDIKAVYNKLCLLLEQEAPGSYCTILLYDAQENRLRSGVAPSIPEDFAKRVDGLRVREGAGSCGTAAHRREAVFVTDVRSDPLWIDFREVALSYEISACWSMPFFSEKGELLGTFTMYHQVPCQPTAHHLKILKTASHLAGIAHQHYHTREQLIQQAFYDQSTQLPNQNFFLKELESRLSKSNSAVFLLELDSLKLNKDSLFPKMAEKFVISFAESLKQIISNDGLLGRLNENQFAILLDLKTDISEAEKLAREIRETLNTPIKVAHQQILLGVDIGIVPLGKIYKNPQEILQDADTAVYLAKANPLAPYVVFDPKVHTNVLSRWQLKADLHQAVKKLLGNQEEEFQLYYQPIISLKTGKLVAFEVLLRWFHREFGLISPATFIPIAEENGLIIPLGNWVFQQACQQIAGWQKKYPLSEDLSLSVNVSICQFNQIDLIEQIEKAITTYQISPSCLKIEITESLLMDTSEFTLARLEKLRQLGIKLSIDDFGTGYSCLSYLYRLPVDTLKIDRSFVQRLGQGQDEIVTAIITLAHSLKMNVVAEGVETIEQSNYLKELGCEFAQGFLFSKPLPQEITENFLRQS